MAETRRLSFLLTTVYFLQCKPSPEVSPRVGSCLPTLGTEREVVAPPLEAGLRFFSLRHDSPPSGFSRAARRPALSSKSCRAGTQARSARRGGRGWRRRPAPRPCDSSSRHAHGGPRC